MSVVAAEPKSPVAEVGEPGHALAATGRLASLDAYRGWVMLLMLAEMLHLSQVAKALPESAVWKFLAHHQTHVEWAGCSLHDLIQPSFTFLVGAALPFSLAKRRALGSSTWAMALHAFWRALVLVLLGVFLRSLSRPQTYWTFEDTLTQIGLGYGFVFLLGLRPVRDQLLALGLVLIGYWAAFVLYPTPGPNFDWSAINVPPDWPHNFVGFAAHWNKNTNLAWAFDTWFLNLFPREEAFRFNRGGYATLSFIPTLGTMILGLLAGGVLRSDQSAHKKLAQLILAGAICFVLALVPSWLGVSPIVKRIWTPGWVLFSGGWCFLIAAAFYAAMDVGGWKAWAFPLVVIGANSIVAYCMDWLAADFVRDNLTRHFGEAPFQILGPAYAPLLLGGATLLLLWLILLWMYRQRLFLKI